MLYPALLKESKIIYKKQNNKKIQPLYSLFRLVFQFDGFKIEMS